MLNQTNQLTYFISEETYKAEKFVEISSYQENGQTLWKWKSNFDNNESKGFSHRELAETNLVRLGYWSYIKE